MLRAPILAVFAALLAAFALAHNARAQADAEPQAEQGGEVALEVDFFGVGNVARAGEWTGLRLRLRERGERPRPVTLRMRLPDPDGDELWVERDVTVNAGVDQSVWLYAPMPWALDRGSVFSVTAVDAAEPVDPVVRPTRGRQVGSVRAAPRRPLDAGVGVIGVLGRAPAGGLLAYATMPDEAILPGSAHEQTEVVTDIDPADLPDRWMGLAAFEALVWLQGEPGALGERQAEALREWVIRGGRLVIALPPVGQSWTAPRGNPLADILPAVDVRRVEEADLNDHRLLLRPRGDARLPARAAWHVLTPRDGAEPADALTILRAPTGEPVVARRLLGAGSVTLIGYDLGNPALGAVVDAQSLWHRVLGKRFDVLTREQMREIEAASRGSFRNRDRAFLDVDVASEIAKSGRAGAGVLLGLVVFGLYLAIAGPGGYALLRRRGLSRHAWPAFVAVAGLFTAIAWGGASALRPLKPEIQHLTVLTHVYGQPFNRARSFVSALLPTYGEQTVSIAPPIPGAPQHNAVAPWEGPDDAAVSRFPDSRGYVLDARAPDSLTVPARSTVKQFRVDWAGPPPLAMPTPQGGDVRLVETTDRLRIEGVIAHNLPAALEDVTLTLVRGQTPLRREPGVDGPLLAVVSSTRLAEPWAPGVPLDLSQVFQPSQVEPGEGYFEALAGEFAGVRADQALGPAPFDARRASRRYEALTWFSALRQPDYRSRDFQPRMHLQRRLAHGLDLSAWLTQPCVIVVGHLNGAACPVPLRIDDREAPSRGRVVVQWVHPLGARPPAPAP